jgi:CRISPR-associated protein Cas1
MSMHGKYKGRLISGFGKNIELRRLQFEKMACQDTILSLSKAYVYGKLTNCRVLLRRYNNSLQSKSITEALHQLRYMTRKALDSDSVPTVMGLEGKSGAVYFGVFGQLLKGSDFTFDGRNRRPPRDPVNVLLSLGYTLLENVIQTQINITGLDPYLGCLHSVEYGRASLVLDLMEEFRPVLVDSLVLHVVNKKIIQQRDFYRPEEHEPAAFDFAETEPAKGELPIILTHTGLKKFISQFEARLNQEVFYEPKSTRLQYRAVCLEQARNLVRHLKGEEQYASFLMR